MSKHTKGPWVATKFNPVTGEIDDCYLYVEPHIAVIERKVKGHDQHDTANANLIASAPELLETLDIMCELDENNVYMDEVWRSAFSKARAAIAKAKGEQA